MKNIILLIGLFISINLISQTKSTETMTITVNGNCGECKERIENAADIKGVKVCTWEEKTHIATITYSPDKVTPDQIKQAIVKAGHDVDNLKASEAGYKKLPKCCQYRDNKCEEKK